MLVYQRVSSKTIKNRMANSRVGVRVTSSKGICGAQPSFNPASVGQSSASSWGTKTLTWLATASWYGKAQALLLLQHKRCHFGLNNSGQWLQLYFLVFNLTCWKKKKRHFARVSASFCCYIWGRNKTKQKTCGRRILAHLSLSENWVYHGIPSIHSGLHHLPIFSHVFRSENGHFVSSPPAPWSPSPPRRFLDWRNG